MRRKKYTPAQFRKELAKTKKEIELLKKEIDTTIKVARILGIPIKTRRKRK